MFFFKSNFKFEHSFRCKIQKNSIFDSIRSKRVLIIQKMQRFEYGPIEISRMFTVRFGLELQGKNSGIFQIKSLFYFRLINENLLFYAKKS